MSLNIQKNIFEIILKKCFFQKCSQEQKDIDEFLKQIVKIILLLKNLLKNDEEIFNYHY